jgi:succinyl-diaminopimelate desuccinylase
VVTWLQKEQLFAKVDALKPEMVNALLELLRVPAVGPENGGEGELAKAEVLMKFLCEVCFDVVERFDAADSRVPAGKRPNIVATLQGESTQRLVIVTHLDVVPAGEEALWKVTKPFTPLVVGERVFGRGSEDNGQSVVSAVFAAKALKQLGWKPKRTVCLVFVSDEEMGSTIGILHLLAKGLFRRDDLVVVPDHGTPDGSFIEVAEKSILWLKLTTFGKQSHGSLPTKGLNAHRIGMQTALALDELLHAKYNAQNAYFDVPYSTFEPTRKDQNVEAINIVPGEDVVYFDCRILPNYNVKEVLADVQTVVSGFEKKTGATIKVDIVQNQPAPQQVDAETEVTKLLKCALKEARGLEANVGGVGGGTCAAFFRKEGIPAAVWSTIDEVPHQPDEYAKIGNMVADAKVFALMALL